MIATQDDLIAAIDGTWPAKRLIRQGAWTLRDGDGGGKRVSAATAEGPVAVSDIAGAAAAMREIGQAPLFMLREGEEDLDSLLEGEGYEVIDPVTVYACTATSLTDIPIPRVTAFTLWEPLAIMTEIWEQGGIGPARIRVMHRAAGPKTGVLCRLDDKPAGVAFVAIHDGVAMVHAVEVLPHQRRKGAAAWIMRAAAFWAADHGAHTLSALCTEANSAANRLYASLGFSKEGRYHYRQIPKEAS